MHRGYRLLSSLLLTATLASPVALMAAANPQDEKNQDHKNQENRQGENNKRYYDKSHKQYHTWDSKEDSAYQRYQAEHHEKRAFDQLSSKQQTAYWNWRHDHPDDK